ncbi:YgbB domain-containing protein [Cephalotus follicularis]|uniref:2-C-methyl-D-erythritol 2,4-cyclodiphosphate synthase n=1 Tax=Cephalotus follicularis TaxID=3775 RepID=A0A1Q3C7D1_CEPFO|nr:YgbB domain-containing protein [Cephalotus follicularis]
MAMAATPFHFTSPITTTKPINKPSPLCFHSIKHPTFLLQTSPLCLKPPPGPTPRSAAAATTAIQLDGPTASNKSSKSLPFRVGHGFDLHRLEPGYPLIIGGIDIPHDRGCEAHSDGDVLLHCVVDAILGALGLPDIGQIFPDSDPKWKGAPSSVFIKEAVRLMHEAGYEIGNLDATLILQRPKLSPLKETIRTNLSKLLGADPSVVNLKAKTHEKVDSLGENRSIAAHTVVLLMQK